MNLRNFRLAHPFAVMIVLFVLGFVMFGGWAFKALYGIKVNGP